MACRHAQGWRWRQIYCRLLRSNGATTACYWVHAFHRHRYCKRDCQESSYFRKTNRHFKKKIEDANCFITRRGQASIYLHREEHPDRAILADENERAIKDAYKRINDNSSEITHLKRELARLPDDSKNLAVLDTLADNFSGKDNERTKLYNSNFDLNWKVQNRRERGAELAQTLDASVDSIITDSWREKFSPSHSSHRRGRW